MLIIPNSIGAVFRFLRRWLSWVGWVFEPVHLPIRGWVDLQLEKQINGLGSTKL